MKGRRLNKIILFAVIILGAYIAFSYISRDAKVFFDKLNPFQSKTTVDATGIAIESINEIGEIITAQYYGETYCTNKEKTQREQIVYLGRGIVTAGICIDSIKREHFQFNRETKSVQINNLVVSIIDSIINPWFIPGKLEGFKLFYSGKKYEKFDIIKEVKMSCVSNLKTDAIRMDIKLKALSNAEETLSHFVDLVTDGAYTKVALTEEDYFKLKFDALNTDSIVDAFEFGGLVAFIQKWNSEYDPSRYNSMEEQRAELKSFCEKVSSMDFVIENSIHVETGRKEKAIIDSLLTHISGKEISDTLLVKKQDGSKSPKNHKHERAYGIDIYRAQKNEVSNSDLRDLGLSFVICKATEGVTFIDSMFYENWRSIKEKNLIRGAYHFYRAQDSPKKQVEHYLSVLGPTDKTDFPPIIDFEEKSIDSRTNARRIERDLLKTFELLESRTGRTPILYSDLNVAETYLKSDKWARYPIWIAEYNNREAPKLPSAWQGQDWTLWQKSDSYKLDGQLNDLDLFNGTTDQLRAFLKSL